MRKPAVALLLATVLMSLMITSAYASTASIEAKISSVNQELNVAFKFVVENATYHILKSNSSLFNETSVPGTIQRNFVSEGHTGLTYSNAAISYNDTGESILSTFQLSGQGVISYTIDRTAGTESFQVSTIWREFSLNITDGPFFNFTQDLSSPLTQWTNSSAKGIASFSYSNSTAGVSCIFELPSSATNVALTGTTISFNVPYQVPWEDKLIDSPVLVLIALAVAGLIIFVYRKTR